MTLIDLPAAIISSIAGRPSFVAGIFTYRFGLSISAWKRRASAIVPSVSPASVGSTSIETYPRRPLPSSQTLRIRSHASPMSRPARATKISFGSSSCSSRSRIWSS